MWIGKEIFLFFFSLDLGLRVKGSGECGKPVPKRGGKIIGGDNAKKGEFPFLVSLRGPEEPQAVEELHKCGAVLLNERWILTAAHCVYEYRRKKFLARLKARLGEHDTSANGSPSYQDIGVETLIIHSQYQDPHRQSNDIALLRLNRNAVFNDVVWPACLPSASVDVTGMNATVAGWGLTSKKPSGPKKSVLQKVNVPVLANGACKKMFGEAGQSYPLEDNQMCAGFKEGGKDSCSGDSGGPLFINLNDKQTVIGLVSAGIECGSPLLPGIYTRVISHLDWIRNQMKS